MQPLSEIEINNLDNFYALPLGAPMTCVERAHLSDLNLFEVDPLEESPLSVDIVFAYILWLEARVANLERRREDLRRAGVEVPYYPRPEF